MKFGVGFLVESDQGWLPELGKPGRDPARIHPGLMGPSSSRSDPPRILPRRLIDPRRDSAAA
jgi:hypothetical protein